MHLISASRLFNDYNVTCLDIEAYFQLQIIMGTIGFTIMRSTRKIYFSVTTINKAKKFYLKNIFFIL